MKDLRYALTFDDVLLKPGLSKILPKDAVLKTDLTKKIFGRNPHIVIQSNGFVIEDLFI